MIRVIVLMTLMLDARIGDVIAALAAGDWRNALGPVPLEELRDLVLGSAWREHQEQGCPGAVPSRWPAIASRATTSQVSAKTQFWHPQPPNGLLATADAASALSFVSLPEPAKERDGIGNKIGQGLYGLKPSRERDQVGLDFLLVRSAQVSVVSI